MFVFLLEDDGTIVKRTASASIESREESGFPPR